VIDELIEFVLCRPSVITPIFQLLLQLRKATNLPYMMEHSVKKTVVNSIMQLGILLDGILKETQHLLRTSLELVL
jgi:hypothetical protein